MKNFIKNNISNILVIDDSKLFLKHITRSLENEKYINLKTLDDPRKAIEVALDFKPELILTDLEMPYLNGIELLKLFKDHPLLKLIPVVVLSSSDGESHLITAVENGAHDFFNKNLSPKLFLVKVINLLRHKKIVDNELKIKQLEMLNHYIVLSNHEFNNALFVADGHLKKLKKECAKEHLPRLEKMEEMNERMNKLVKKLESLKNINIDEFEEEIKFLKVNY